MAHEEIEQVEREALAELDEIESEEALDDWRVAWLGKSGRATGLVRRIGSLPAEERPSFGKAVNALKESLEEALAARAEGLRERALAAELEDSTLDVTLPGARPPAGGLHPATVADRRALSIYADMGFQVYLSREVETDERNFELLNMPRHHPARDMQDTFYIDDQVVLRTHTSPGQIHAMREYAPEPIRIVLPGMVYRAEQVTVRSEMQFTQIEGLAVGPRITMADLKGTIENFARRYYGPERPVRFRASYFPFTEPSAEVDVRCTCGGEGCRLCKGTGWLEVMGCGMVHPVVLENGGYDPTKVSGFAFGGGTMRTQMLAHGIDDIRHYWANDLRFLEQLR